MDIHELDPTFFCPFLKTDRSHHSRSVEGTLGRSRETVSLGSNSLHMSMYKVLDSSIYIGGCSWTQCWSGLLCIYSLD